MKVAILESLGISEEELKNHMIPFEERGVEFSVFQRTNDEETLIKEVGDSEVVVIAKMPFSSSVISKCKNLKYISVAFTGTDHVGIEEAKKRGIVVSNASGYSNEAVSELAIGMTLSLYRKMREVEERCRSGSDKSGLIGNEIKGKNVGIVGLGKIGRRSAELFHAFGANILSTSLHKHSDAPSFVKELELDELLSSSDIILLHCPLNSSTKGLINKEKLEKMKSSAILVNVARGPVVIEKDLVEALKNGTIRGAAIDVFDTEPPLSSDNPIFSAPNTLLTPHVAFATVESMKARADIVFDNLKSYLNGEVKNRVC